MTPVKRWLHFGLAVAVLFPSALGLYVAQRMGWVILVKKALPIRKPLVDFDREVFAPLSLKFVSSGRLSAEMVAELGTEEYINWILE